MAHVVIRLMGGLGNQLFQYATGAAMAQRHGVPLLLDRGFLDHRPRDMTWTPRAFELDRLRAPIAFAPASLVRALRRPWTMRGYRHLHWLLPGRFPMHGYREQGTGFDARVAALKPPIYLEGFWQNEGYFAEIAEQLRTQWFVPRDAPDARNSELMARFASEPCASLHVRRGDYVTDPQTAALHGICDAGYYARAAEALIARCDVQRFVVFSDDPAWARANLKLPRPADFIDHNTGNASHWDLFLMSRCTHHIIANSSFSWWGAWLNPSLTKIVIGPKRWYKGIDAPAHDILPAAWIAL